MKTTLKLSLAFWFLALTGASAAAEVKFAPYYSLNIMEAVSVPTKGNTLWPLNLTNDLGLMATLNDRHKLMGFYELRYTGPGLKKEEGQNFTDRMMDHVLVLRHEMKLSDIYILKTQVDTMKEYVRTGANEIWGSGLYDFNRTGIAFYLKRQFGEDISAEASVQLHSLAFPNYTDLLQEYQAGADAESSSGKQNQDVYQIGFSGAYGPNTASLELMFMNYTKQKVITETAQADGTYYSSDLQKDSYITLNVSREQKLWGRIAVTPSLSYKIKSSNQNFQDFATATSTVPVQYVGKFYDYTETVVSLPCSLMLNEKWDYFLNFEFDYRNYSSRPPRDADNNFLAGTQYNNITIWGTGFVYKPNDVTRTTFFYQYQGAASNMQFEKYLPYNYGGHTLGINFNYSY